MDADLVVWNVILYNLVLSKIQLLIRISSEEIVSLVTGKKDMVSFKQDIASRLSIQIVSLLQISLKISQQLTETQLILTFLVWSAKMATSQTFQEFAKKSTLTSHK